MRKVIKSDKKVIDNDDKLPITNPLQVINNPSEITQNDTEVTPYKVIKYRKFIKILQSQGYTTARLMAKTLEVNDHTILKWLKTSKAQLALENDINSYVKTIQSSKDWKAHAYLLDKVTNKEHKDSPVSDLKQLIVINTNKS